ncbi:CocE/NonD family hydrolase [Streptomyces himalayensis]|uniref:CocE/NonD family hydrolase n=1 Tax=Streptomyces himalayensis TaxID=2820085 RepID=UPI001C66F8C8|nr:CocE/NonD family hydrolase [Streptomyces himalayensis]
MRDGTVLRADVYRPGGTGPWPVLPSRLPYVKQTPMTAVVLDPRHDEVDLPTSQLGGW